jgi:uncharacterized protein (DUF433 family)
MIPAKSYVEKDGHGVFRVGGTRISLDSVVNGYRQGFSAETIQDQYPGLSLEQVHGAIAFYLANREEVDQYLLEQEKVWEEFRRKTDETPSPVVERLRGLRLASKKDSQ